MERRALGNPEAKCLLIGFREEQSNASLIGAFMLARGVSRLRKVQRANFITKPDKGSGVVIMDKSDYVRLLKE